MQYAKKAGHHMGAKHTVGICGKVGDSVSEKEPPGVPGNQNGENKG